ncbi:MAG: glycosyltransferase family 4 protein [Hyphomicrobiales bacterium]|nr:glycosyltransferase family 4 protein [Hyphomicrobiales bacterium]MDE2115951.1 glycosyltransferase family 4 protein [Hyphomicrobiales bacterium]
MTILFDATLSLTALGRATPSGIHRVEWAYLQAFSEGEDADNFRYLLNAGYLRGAVLSDSARKIVSALDAQWHQAQDPHTDDSFLKIIAWLQSEPDLKAISAPKFNGISKNSQSRMTAISLAKSLATSHLRLRSEFKSHHKPKVYFNASHYHLHMDGIWTWLATHKCHAVFFVHDVIPLTHPEFCAPISFTRHVQRLKAVSTHADHVIVNSQTTASDVASYLKRTGQRVPPLSVVPLGISEAFMPGYETPEHDGLPPYFLCVGTIEPRKNIGFLLAIWRRLIERHGARTPRLLLVGARGWEMENIADLLERSQSLAPHVAEIGGLSDRGLASLMLGARGLLSPSFVEGFGLPLIEAMALGLPVLASNISAHSEHAAGDVRLLDPLDGPSWISAIEDLAMTSTTGMTRLSELTPKPRPHLWAECFARTKEILSSFD